MHARSLFLTASVLVAGFSLAAGSIPALAEAEMPREILDIAGSKKTVKFDHARHERKGVECGDCHHQVKDQDVRKACSSEGCHDDRETTEGPRSLHRVMHGRNLEKATCLSCHAEAATKMVDARKKKQMLGCESSKCHPW